MRVIDGGHKYELVVLDGIYQKHLVLQFVKRIGIGHPGNTSEYAGTNCQEVLRAVVNRVRYLNSQRPHYINKPIIGMVKIIIWLFEFRAARMRKQWYWHGLDFSENSRLCQICGHTDCRKLHGFD